VEVEARDTAAVVVDISRMTMEVEVIEEEEAVADQILVILLAV
jgi:hypothetical protein